MKLAFRCLSIAVLSAGCVFAQKTSSGGTASGTGTSGSTGTTPSTGGTNGGAPANTAPAIQATPVQTTPPLRPIFISGAIATDDGSPLPNDIAIQSLCNSQQKTVAHASPDGTFTFDWSSNSFGFTFGDASDNSRPTLNQGPNSTSNSGTSTRGVDPLATCDLRASASGYTSTRVGLFQYAGSDRFDIGSLVLHHVTGDEGRTVSTLALRAPKDARKSFGKGTDQMKAHKTADAIVSFRKAVQIYPQYADCWFSLGKAELESGAKDDAKTDFRKAMELDDKLVGPWQELGYMASDQGKWEEAARYLDQAVRLDPVDSPMAWYFSAAANFNLGRYEQAERSVRAEMKLDKNPQAQYLLGLVLIARKDLQGGADALRSYIALGPKPEYLNSAKQQLVRVEGLLAR